ncbi:BrnT family toxin [Massilia sp. SM-13]|uniref:BrnT family toxin n=1 Tax=Pseudoduganella rhizocola TaxID=3382643 RepID=UPI0038B44C8A
MDIAYDAAKDRANVQRHGISLAVAARINWAAVLEKLDDRDDYGEDRYKVLGFIEGLLYAVVYVDRNNLRRIISLRKASRREYREYEENY